MSIEQVMGLLPERSIDSDPGDHFPLGCPACGAALRGEVTWCLRCYADLRNKPAEVPPRDRIGLDIQTSDSPGGFELAGLADEPLDQLQINRLADQMIAQLASTSSKRSSWRDRAPRTPLAVIGWGVLGLVILSGLLLVIGAVVGQFLKDG